MLYYILYISDPSASIAEALLTFLDDDASLDTILERTILRSVVLKGTLMRVIGLYRWVYRVSAHQVGYALHQNIKTRIFEIIS